MILKDEDGRRYKATCVGERVTRGLYEIEEISTKTPWWKQLPPHTPVEVRYFDGDWTVVPASHVGDSDHVRWPPPRDGWAHARKCGFTHIVVQVSGTVILTDSASGWPDEAVLVPIPRQEDSDDVG